ncbi:response regulator [bacterium]|nr:response regulator [bacterium]
MQQYHRILLIGSDIELTQLLLAAFDEHKLADRLDLVGGCEEALNYLLCCGAFRGRATGNPSVVLLDRDSLTTDALKILRQIRADSRLRLLPVVMLSSTDRVEDVLESYQTGASAYVVRPTDFHQHFEMLMGLGFFWGVINQPPVSTETPQQAVAFESKPLELAVA